MRKWSKKILNENGWIKNGRYWPGGREYFYTKGKLDVRVSMDYHYILTYCGAQMRQINSIEELKEYELTGR